MADYNWYRDIAQAYDSVIRHESYSPTHAYSAFKVILDLESSSYEYAQELELRFLLLFFRTYVQIKYLWGKEVRISILIKKINNYVIEKGFEGDLTNFVNNITWSENYSYRVPYYWALECKNLKFDTTGWEIEPNPNPS